MLKGSFLGSLSKRYKGIFWVLEHMLKGLIYSAHFPRIYIKMLAIVKVKDPLSVCSMTVWAYTQTQKITLRAYAQGHIFVVHLNLVIRNKCINPIYQCGVTFRKRYNTSIYCFLFKI